MAEKSSNLETRILQGVSISPGLATGKAFVFKDILDRDPDREEISEGDIGGELERIQEAISAVLAELKDSAERIEEEFERSVADIFRAHEEMLRDPALVDEFKSEIRKERVRAEEAIRRVCRHWEENFRSMEKELFQRRGDDVVDLGRRLLRSLAGVQTHSLEQMPKGSILVAARLLPSDTTFFTCRSAAGIAVESGGPGSHCALLTRQMGIPGIAQAPDLTDSVSTGDTVLLDGLRGTLTVNPDKASRKEFQENLHAYRKTTIESRRKRHESATTKDGLTIPVMANIGNREDAEMAAENGADGVGLFRIEVFFLGRKMLPSPDELLEGLTETLEPLEGKPVTIRLLDIGGDKVLPYLPLPPEPDPALGRRGVRLLAEYPELLHSQLRILLRLSRERDIRILVPMVTVPEDMILVREALKEAATELDITSLPPLGAMIEIPAAALCTKEIAEVSDFLNIGSNDLTQFTMAAGRENGLVSRYFLDDHPALFRLIGIIGSGRGEKPLGICGELAGHPTSAEALLRSGVRMFSVPPLFIPNVKAAVRGMMAK